MSNHLSTSALYGLLICSAVGGRLLTAEDAKLLPPSPSSLGDVSSGRLIAVPNVASPRSEFAGIWSSSGESLAALGAAGLVRPQPVSAPVRDLCNDSAIVASPSRPVWDSGAATTQCGNLETDYGWQYQPMSMGVHQQSFATSLRYGLTPRMDLRWGLTNRIYQGGGGLPEAQGIGDQSLSTTLRFLEQGAHAPAMAFSYGVKIPMANPAKGFGTGFTDHSFVLVASRDLGKLHVDSNVMGVLGGSSRGFDGATLAGLALSRPVTPKLTAFLETCGGSQPGTSDRAGTALLGATYSLKPHLVFDVAIARTYTAAISRTQFTAGCTYSRRAGFPTLPKGSKIARLLGR